MVNPIRIEQRRHIENRTICRNVAFASSRVLCWSIEVCAGHMHCLAWLKIVLLNMRYAHHSIIASCNWKDGLKDGP